MQSESIQTLLVEKTLDHARFLIACAEPVKAHKVLAELAPVSVLHHPRIVAMRASLEKQIDQWFSDEAYIRRYTEYDNGGGVPNEPFSDTNLRNLFRAQATTLFARSKQPRRYLSVGGGEGTVPLMVLEGCPNTDMTLSELLGVGGTVAKALSDKFPGRVHVTGRYDTAWHDTDPAFGFDFIECLEVVEHVTDDALFLSNLRTAASDEATLCLSTPNSTDWIESRLVEEFGDGNWYHHVRAYSPRSLTEVLLRAGWLPTIFYVDKTLYVMATPTDPTEPDFTEEVSWSDVPSTTARGKVCPAQIVTTLAGREVIVVCLEGTLLVP